MAKKVGAHRQVALDALKENQDQNTVGDFLRAVQEMDGSVSYFFAAKQKGYEGWEWCVTVFEADSQSTVSEIVLLPSENALLAPAWVPWSERLAEWKAMQAELEAQAAELESEGDQANADSEEDDETDSSDAEESNWVDATDTGDESEDLATQELRVIKEVSFAVDDEATEEGEDSVDGSALANLEVGEDSETDSDDAGKRPPRLSRRNRFWGKKKKQ